MNNIEPSYKLLRDHKIILHLSFQKRAIMGKQKRQRQKFHESPANKLPRQNKEADHDSSCPSPFPLLNVNPDLFKGLNVRVSDMNTELSDDLRSVKSFKSLKSDLTNDKVLSKKEKLKLRRDFLLRKIDTINQLKKENEARKKRKQNAIIGDTNPLHDTLPSLENLLQSNSRLNQQPTRVKGIQTAKARRRQMIKEIGLYKKMLNDQKFIMNPRDAISEHIKAIVNQEIHCKR